MKAKTLYDGFVIDYSIRLIEHNSTGSKLQVILN